jgi:hypothetical protein
MEVPITPGELGRAHALAYTGRNVKVLLCSGALTINSDSAACLAAELPATNGYVRYELASLPAGAWNATDLRFDAPEIAASFTATGAGYTYSHLVVIVDDAANPYTVVDLGSVDLAAGTRQYPITIGQRSAV